MDPWAISGAPADEASVHSVHSEEDQEVHGERRQQNSEEGDDLVYAQHRQENSDEWYEDYEDGEYNPYGCEDQTEESSDDYDSENDEMRLVYTNHIPQNACKVVDDEEYEKKLDLAPSVKTDDEFTLKMIRGHIVGGMMADFKYINQGVEPYQMNMTLGEIGLGQWTLERMAELIITDESLEKCQQNPANLLLHPMIKDVVNFDVVNNKYKPLMNTETMREMAAEIYRTGVANQKRKEVDETQKSQKMNLPEHRKQYMAANDMLVNMMVRIYNDNCRTMDELVTWDEIRRLYEEFRDEEHRHHDLFEQYSKILPLRDASFTLNPKSVKLIFGRSKLKDFLSDAIYQKINFVHDKQIQLSLNDKVENCIYTPQAYEDVEEEIQRRKHTGNRFDRGSKMTKEQRRKDQKYMELEEKKRSFVPIPLPCAHIPVANEPPANIFGSTTPVSPKREKEEYVCSPVNNVSPADHEEYGDYHGDDDASSYCERPKEEHNFTDSDEEPQRTNNTRERSPSPEPVVARNPFQSFNNGGHDYDSDISSDCERPDPTGEKNFTDDEDDVDEKRKEIEQERQRKEEQRRLAKEQKQKKQEADIQKPTSLFSKPPQHNGAVIVPTPPEDRLNLELNIETVQEKAERLQSFINESDKGHTIYEDLSEEELFATEIVKSEKPIYQRPQMPNEQHPLHRKQKELEHQQALVEKEKARKAKEEAKRKQEEEQRRIEQEEEEQRLAEEQRVKEETERKQREAEKKRLLEELERKEREENEKIQWEEQERMKREQTRTSAFSTVNPNPPRGLFSRAASNTGGSVFEEAGFGNRHSPNPFNRSTSNMPHHPPTYTTNNNSPRQQMAQDGIPFPRGPSRQATSSPPMPQLGATRHRTAIRFVDVGTQSEPIDVILEELGLTGASGSEDPDSMSPKEFFVQFIRSHVYAYRGDNCVQQRMWSTMQKGLAAPFDRPESFLGDNWTEVVEREVPKVAATMTRKSGIIFEWMGE